MSRISPSGCSRPKDLEAEQDLFIIEDTPSERKWRRWAIALGVALTVCVVVAVIVGPVCAIKGCPPRHDNVQADEELLPRLIVRFNLPDIDALDVIPAILHSFITRLRLNSSTLQILDFVDEDVLQTAKGYLLKNTELALITRDFLMLYNPNGIDSFVDSIDSIVRLSPDVSQLVDDLTQLVSGGKRRRKLQQLSPVPVTDPFIRNGSQWHHANIRSQVAWASTPGSSSVVVAVIDSGFDLSHPDLLNRVWKNTKEIANNGIDDDGNGYIDDYYGFDFLGACKPGTSNTVGNKTDHMERLVYKKVTTTCVCQAGTNPDYAGTSHGTHVAGLIAAQANNSAGGAGSAPNIRLMLLKVSDCTTDRAISASAVFQALDYAYKMGAHIVSMSLGSNFAYGAQPRSGPLDSRYQDWQNAYISAIQPLTTKNVLVVAAAGNEALDLDGLYRLGYTYTPCGVPLDNVLCVGATDTTDGQAFYSNYGKTVVDMSAPGSSIMSTLPVKVYGFMSGTSMATPILAGTAGLVASVLGSVDGNYFRGAQIKNILLSSGDYLPALVNSSATGTRLNSYNAITLALRALPNTVTSPSLPPVSSLSTQPGAVRIQGFSEAYWTNYNALVLDSSGQSQVDFSVRSGPPQFSGFKFTSGVLVNMTAMLRVNVSGLHTFTMSFPTANSTGSIQVNGRMLGVNGSVATFTAMSSGFYRVSFLFQPPSSGTVTVRLAPPGVAQPGGLYPESYQAWTDSAYVAPRTTNNYTNPQTPLTKAMNSGWWVFMNVTDPVVYNGSSLNTLFRGITPTSTWQVQTAIPDLQLSSSIFRSTLLPGRSFNSVLGVANSTLNPSGMPGQITFTVICKGCAVKLNGMLAIDNWASFTTSLATSKSSACITISPSATYSISVEFASSGSAALLLNWQPCTGGSSSTLSYPARTSLSTAVIDTALAGTQQYIGWIPGVQCDVWRTAAGALAVPATEPLYKFRLPSCPSPDLASSTTCKTTWNFTLDGIIRGGLATGSPAGTLFSVRCWAYTNVTLPGRTLSALPSGVRREVWLAGIQRFRASTTAVELSINAPASIQYGSQLHQLLVEWVGVNATRALNLNANGSPLAITLSAFRLPLWVTADSNNDGDPFDPLLNLKPLGSPGIFAQAYTRTSTDILNILGNDMAQVGRVAANVSTDAQALVGSITFPSAQLTTVTFYTVTEGYYWTINDSPDWSQLVFDDAAGACTEIVAGDVVIRNAPAFNAASGAVLGIAVQLYLPPGYLRLRLITKVRSTTATVTYNSKAMTDGRSDLPLDLGGWLRVAWQT